MTLLLTLVGLPIDRIKACKEPKFVELKQWFDSITPNYDFQSNEIKEAYQWLSKIYGHKIMPRPETTAPAETIENRTLRESNGLGPLLDRRFVLHV